MQRGLASDAADLEVDLDYGSISTLLAALHARKIGAVGTLWQFEVTARVGDDAVADGVVVLSEAS